MLNTKLVKLLKTFSKSEIVKFGDFINTPYFNKNKKVAKLGETVLTFYPDFNSELFTEENVLKKIGAEEFDYFKIKILFLICINWPFPF